MKQRRKITRKFTLQLSFVKTKLICHVKPWAQGARDTREQGKFWAVGHANMLANSMQNRQRGPFSHAVVSQNRKIRDMQENEGMGEERRGFIDTNKCVIAPSQPKQLMGLTQDAATCASFLDEFV